MNKHVIKFINELLLLRNEEGLMFSSKSYLNLMRTTKSLVKLPPTKRETGFS